MTLIRMILVITTAMAGLLIGLVNVNLSALGLVTLLGILISSLSILYYGRDMTPKLIKPAKPIKRTQTAYSRPVFTSDSELLSKRASYKPVPRYSESSIPKKEQTIPKPTVLQEVSTNPFVVGILGIAAYKHLNKDK